MAEEKDFGINLNTPLNGSDDELENINFDDVKDTGLDDFLNDVSMENQEMAFTNAKNSVQSNKNDEKDDEISKLSSATSADFANFDIDDFDAALNSYQAARAGKLPRNAPQTQAKTENSKNVLENKSPFQSKGEPVVKPENLKNEKADLSLPNDDISVSNVPEKKYSAEKNVPQTAEQNASFKPATIDESGFRENSEEKQQELLNWYMGELKDKTYEVSPENMPEYLDSDKTIRVIHVSVDSLYGWNVFFDNGVFMSLRDLKEYQERHGEMPCQDGKIIYGSKTVNFERILKIVVYERPHYFSYIVK